MSNYLNYAAMATSRMRSDGLGPTDSIAHPLEPGRYAGIVSLGDAEYGRFEIEVGEDGDGEQVEIDLAGVGSKAGCAAPSLFRAAPIRGTPVFAVFHSDAERRGFRVVLISEDQREQVFDSGMLGAGDYYILMPLQPGRWALSTSAGARGSVTVEQARPGDKPRASQLGTMVRTDGKSFDPAEARIMSGDGLVFEVTGNDVTIEVTMEAKEKPASGKSRVGVRYVRASNLLPQTPRTGPDGTG